MIASEGRSRRWGGLAGVLFALVALGASVAIAQPAGWARQSVRQGELLRFAHFTAPYEGWYCVRVVREDGSIRGWRQVDRRRVDIVSGQLSIMGLASLQAGLAVIPPGPRPPPETADGHTRMALSFRTLGGVERREYAGAIPGPVRAVINMVESAIGADTGGCQL